MIERLLIKDKNQCSSARKTCSIKSFASRQCSGKYSFEIAWGVTKAQLTASKSCLCHLFCFAWSPLISSLWSCNSARRLFVHLIWLWLSVFQSQTNWPAQWLPGALWVTAYPLDTSHAARDKGEQREGTATSLQMKWHSTFQTLLASLRAYQLPEGRVENDVGLLESSYLNSRLK